MRTYLILFVLAVSLWVASVWGQVITPAPTAGLNALWKFDEASGFFAFDSSGYANTGVLVNGPVWTAGKSGAALAFDGADDELNAGHNPILGQAYLDEKSWTYAAWIKPRDMGKGAVGRIFQKNMNGVGSPARYLALTGSNAVRFYNAMTCEDVDVVTASNTITPNAWQFVVAVWDWQSHFGKIYVNGIEKGSDLGRCNVQTDSNEDLIIGNDAAASYTFNGSIDEVRIYNRTLSALEINDLYNNMALTAVVNEPPLSTGATTSSGDSLKGFWGRLTPIADNNHPNLYYNRSEVDELRNMILVQQSPQHLVDLYNRQMKGVLATAATTSTRSSATNLRAAITYMIEPTSVKADAIRTALFAYMNAYPTGLPDWSSRPGPFFSGYSLPWLFDLLMAYNPEKLSSTEVISLKEWFRLSAEYLKFDSRNASAVSTEAIPDMTLEGKTTNLFPNWYSRYMGPSLACALVSGNQAAVDYWGDSGWPHNLFTFDGVNRSYPVDTANRYDLTTYLLAVYPSGANTDTYSREGYNPAQTQWYTTDYTWGMYHFADMYGPIIAAEMAYHNGMTGVFGMTDVPGTEPALLRTYKRAIQSRIETDTQPANPTGHPLLGWDPAIFAGYRRYSDPVIDSALPGIVSYSGPIPSGVGGVWRGYDVPGDVWQFFGYPQHVAWPAGDGGLK